MPNWSRIHDACACRNLICPISLLISGIVVGITGGVLAAVGFGTMPKDMFDYPNQAMRLAGLIMVGIAILPIAVSVVCWLFYCTEKKANRKLMQTSGAPKGRVDQMVLSAGYSPPSASSDSQEQHVMYQYTTRDSGPQHLATGSIYSEQRQYSSSINKHADDYDSSSSSSSSLSDKKSSRKPLTALDKDADDFE